MMTTVVPHVINSVYSLKELYCQKIHGVVVVVVIVKRKSLRHPSLLTGFNSYRPDDFFCRILSNLLSQLPSFCATTPTPCCEGHFGIWNCYYCYKVIASLQEAIQTLTYNPKTFSHEYSDIKKGKDPHYAIMNYIKEARPLYPGLDLR